MENDILNQEIPLGEAGELIIRSMLINAIGQDNLRKLGAGTVGELARVLANHGPSSEVLDVSEDALVILQKKAGVGFADLQKIEGMLLQLNGKKVVDSQEIAQIVATNGEEGGQKNKPSKRVRTFRKDDKTPPGRNDPCHCGSGQKFKKCHGK